MKYKKKSHWLVGVSPLALAACGGGDGEENSGSISGTIESVDQPNRSVVAWGSPGAGGDFAAGEQRSDILSIFLNTNAFAALTSSDEVIARGGKVLMLTDNDDYNEPVHNPWKVVNMPKAATLSSPILYAIPLQLLAYYTAIAKGTDVDQPRNLAKSVTVE